MVRLKRKRLDNKLAYFGGLNSTMVRLKPIYSKEDFIKLWSQFHYGSIKTQAQ